MDATKLNHSRGFEKYWEVPATDTTALNGRWVPGAGAKLSEAVSKALGNLPIIAEELGLITPEVETLREQFGFPGMKVLRFAFDSDPKADDCKPDKHHHKIASLTHPLTTTMPPLAGSQVKTQKTAPRPEKETEREATCLELPRHTCL